MTHEAGSCFNLMGPDSTNQSHRVVNSPDLKTSARPFFPPPANWQQNVNLIWQPSDIRYQLIYLSFITFVTIYEHVFFFRIKVNTF